jgi:hypothetical protein
MNKAKCHSDLDRSQAVLNAIIIGDYLLDEESEKEKNSSK